ncbi:MAG: iron-sulfur cluster repair di-iron protein [Myxococcales bacterium]|nr:iron-sulfur cluster repair di-iron protein [Myxococcales bacterium]
MQLLTTPIGDIAAAQPSSTRVFLRHRLDFCCGGQRTLEEACVKADLNPAEVAEEIEREAGRGDDLPRWAQRSQAELVDHIEGHYHAGLRRDLPPLIEAARKVERVHAAKPAVPAGLADVLTEFFGEMQSHMAKEEQILFPMLRRGARGPAVAMPIEVMEHEHDAHGVQLARIRELTGDLRIPPHACATWTALYRGLAAIEAELMAHIHLENHVLFARAIGAAG